MQTRTVAFTVVVLFAINILNFYDRQVTGALAEPMRREFGLTDTELGLMGSAFIWMYAIVGVPIGLVADRWSRKRLLVAGLAVWASMTAMGGLVQSFGWLLVTRLGVGIGEAVCAPAGTSWLGDLFPPERRARVLALFMLGVPVGGAMSYFCGGPIAQAWGWRAAMVTAALPAVLLLPALATLREPVHEAGAGTAAPVRELLRLRTLWWIIASGVFLNFNMYAMASFLPALLGRVHGMSVAEAGTTAGMTFLVGGIGGGLMAGVLGDRVLARGHHARLRWAAGLTLAGAPLAYWGVVQPAGSAGAALGFLLVAYGTMNTYYGLVYSSIQDLVRPRERGITMAIYFLAMYLCGASFGPLLTGVASDRMARRAMEAAGESVLREAHRAAGLQQAMLLVPVLLAALAAVLWAASRTIAGDIARREGAVTAAAGTARS